jgi:hypothetical protein
VTNDRTLTLIYDEDAGQVVLEGLPCGAAGEAGLNLAAGIELFFDCTDGRLSKVFIEAGEPGSPPAIGESALAVVGSLFGGRACDIVRRAPGRHGYPITAVAEPQALASMSRLARLDVVRFTSPVADSLPWAVEAAQVAQQAGLTARANTEARQAVHALEHANGASLAMLADAIADVVQEAEPDLADRLRKHATVSGAGGRATAHHRRSRSRVVPDVAAAGTPRAGERGGPPGWLDPRLIPPGIFRYAWRPDAELAIRPGPDGILVEARLVPGAGRRMLAPCHARLVDPGNRNVVATATFVGLGGSLVQAKIRAPVPSGGSAWVEVVDDVARPVAGSQLRHSRRAMRWAQAALSAGRQARGLADAEWGRLAADAWGHCADDWSAAGDQDRAYLAAVRRAALRPGAATPQEPSAWAKEAAGRPLLAEEPFLAERIGGLA